MSLVLSCLERLTEDVILVYFSLAKRLVREAEEKVEYYTHPDGYVFNYMPGGTRFMRNAPIPLEVRRKKHYPKNFLQILNHCRHNA